MIKKWLDYIKEGVDKLSHTKEDIYNYTTKLLDSKIEDLFNDVHKEFETESGDISPSQVVELDRLKEKMAKLISEQVFSNTGKDFHKIRTNEIDIDILKDLVDERDGVKKGDDVIVVYFSGGFDIYRFKLKDSGDDGLGYYDGKSGSFNYKWYGLEDAYHVVSVDTYNDFVSPDKRI